MPIELRSNERLIWARERFAGAHEFLHIKVGTKWRTSDPLRGPHHIDVTACGATVYGRPAPDVPREASYATCNRCREKYKPKRGQG